jgi:16S rRNA C967 or C1407 C5-methylase (RsmB/RsmF family)
MTDPLHDLAAAIPDGAAFLAALAGPFRRALRRHPRRGALHGWDALEPVPWNPDGFFHAADIDPASRLDYHTGLAWPQDAASQLPVRLLDPQPGDVVVDACAAPGSKSTQIGLALGADGVLVCCDAAPPRRRVLRETLARQGVLTGLVTPLPLERLAGKHPGAADAVLVDAPCSGHEPRSAKQVARMAQRQLSLLTNAAALVRPGGRLVYSTCTPYREENEAVVEAFLQRHPDWRVAATALPGVDADLHGLGACRLWPQRQGTEPFFACRLHAPGSAAANGFPGDAPPPLSVDFPAPTGWRLWQSGALLLAGSAAVAAAGLPSEARGATSRVPPSRWRAWRSASFRS